MPYLLDTNIVTTYLKNNPTVLDHLETVGSRKGNVFISCITLYEIRRGLIYTNATRQMARLEFFLLGAEVLFLDDRSLLETAANIHQDLRRRGCLIQDADILIAATALHHHLILVSNDSDMLRVSNLPTENWV